MKDAIHNAYCSVNCRNQHFGVHPVLDTSKDLAYILGVIFGDGHVSPDRIVMSVTDKPFADSFHQALERLGFRPTLKVDSVETLINRKPKNAHIMPTKDQYRVSACSREFVRWFQKLDFNILSAMFNSSELIVAFLRGFYESDGSVHEGYLSFHNTDLPLLEFTQQLTDHLGFKFRIYETKHLPSGKICYALTISAKPSIGRFLAIVKPCVKNQHSHYNPAQIELNL